MTKREYDERLQHTTTPNEPFLSWYKHRNDPNKLLWEFLVDDIRVYNGSDSRKVVVDTITEMMRERVETGEVRGVYLPKYRQRLEADPKFAVDEYTDMDPHSKKRNVFKNFYEMQKMFENFNYDKFLKQNYEQMRMTFESLNKSYSVKNVLDGVNIDITFATHYKNVLWARKEYNNKQI